MIPVYKASRLRLFSYWTDGDLPLTQLLIHHEEALWVIRNRSEVLQNRFGNCFLFDLLRYEPLKHVV